MSKDYTLEDVKKFIQNELNEEPRYKNVEIDDIEVTGYKAIYIHDDNRLITVIDEDNDEDFHVALFISNSLSVLEDEDTMNDHYVDSCVPSGLDGIIEMIMYFLEEYYPEFDDEFDEW